VPVKQAALQLRLVRAILRAERQRGTDTPEMAERASAIVEQTAIAIEPSADSELIALLASVRAEIAELASD
jgi:hypothetical protein